MNIFFYREHRVQKSPIRVTPSNLRVSASPLSSVESVIIRDIRVPILEPICGICITILNPFAKKTAVRSWCGYILKNVWNGTPADVYRPNGGI